MKNTRLGIIIIAVLVVIAVAIALLGPQLVKKGEGTREAGDTSALVKSKGMVESEEETELRSLVSGAVREMLVKEGDPVGKGDTLVIIDNAKAVARVAEAEAMTREAKARLRQMEAGFRAEDVAIAKERAERAEAIYRQADDEFRRQQRLYEKDATTLLERNRAEEKMKVASAEWNEAQSLLKKYRKGERKEDIDASRAALSRSTAELEYSRSLLADHTLRSPINGVVTDRMKKRGEMVDIGTPVLKLINPQKMRIRAEVDETDSGKVTEGMTVEVVADAFAGKIYRGKVTRVLPHVKRKAQKSFDPMASYDINTEQIYIDLDTFKGLKNGMTVTVRFLK
ncbi:MAG TPA: HlyD family efflux transporter periplasmic adaptor subunit [Geobacteraceae bacterium]|nr:HlyD family efflux transporter periplasmic adaptor subunit [Geobacteraceae bacterium]